VLSLLYDGEIKMCILADTDQRKNIHLLAEVASDKMKQKNTALRLVVSRIKTPLLK